jgi:Protein of unknown function (DUF2510)
MTTATPAGWFPDPSGSGQLRYWDGAQWTAHLHPVSDRPPPRAPRSGATTKILLGVGVAFVLVIAGIIALAIIGARSTTTAPKAIPAIHVHLGQPIDVPAAYRVEGIASATVYSLRYPAQADVPTTTPDLGTEFAVADVQLCAGNSAVHYDEENLAPYPFSVVLSDGSSAGVLYTTVVKAPQVVDTAQHLKANQCTRGFMAFEFDTNLIPVAVGYGAPDPTIYEWALRPAGSGQRASSQ